MSVWPLADTTHPMSDGDADGGAFDNDALPFAVLSLSFHRLSLRFACLIPTSYPTVTLTVV